MTSVAHRVVVITEATGAVGEACALAFAGPKTSLILAGRDLHDLAALAGNCLRLGATVETVQAQTGDTASLRRLVNAVRMHDRVDVWISLGADDADLKAALPLFVRQKRGVFVAAGGAEIPAAVRAPLSARRDVHLCEIHSGSRTADAGRIAAAIVDVVRVPRPKTTVGANDSYADRFMRAGSGFSMTTLAGWGAMFAALGQLKLG